MPEVGRRILITGAAGFLGEATLEYLTRDSANFVVAVDVNPTRGPAGETRRFVSVIRDVTQPVDDLLDDYSIDTVIHLAFMLQAQRDPDHARAVNVGATDALLASCSRTRLRQFVYLSSATVYGAHKSNSRPFVETDPANPVKGFTYSEHKAEAERLVLQFGETHPECAISILRGCVVMGPGSSNFITDSLGLKVLPVPAGANPEMQFLHVDDYCATVGAVLMNGSRGIFNIAGSGTISWREMVKLAGGRAVPVPAMALRSLTDMTWKLGLQRRSTGVGISFIQYPWLVSTEKLEQQTDWKPRHSSEQAVRSWASSR